LEQHQSNPAITFLKDPQNVESPEQLMQNYANYLLKEANIHQFPVKLTTIRRRFPFPIYAKRLPQESRGCITDSLRIFLNSTDRSTVQQFTLAHEFMEMLFLALKDGAADNWMSDQLFEDLQKCKESLCDVGAAELLMPLPFFREFVSQFPISFTWVQEIATRCQLSLMAILRRIVETSLSPLAMIIWCYKRKPKERRDLPKKMRVERWFLSPDLKCYIPHGKSVPPASSIYRAFFEKRVIADFEEINLKGIHGHYFIEAFPYNISGKHQVISLIHLSSPYNIGS
jgi:Zn-dependent peptidase ImmA (M78 family)